MEELRRQLTGLSQGTHLCLFSAGKEGRSTAARMLISDGLARRERCLYMGEESAADALSKAVSAEGPDMAIERARDALRFSTGGEIRRLPSGELDPSALAEFLRKEALDALADGCTGIRLAIDMSWVMGAGVSAGRLIEYEAIMARLASGRATILCLYDGLSLGPAMVHDVLRTHPATILGDQVQANPYYEPPDLIAEGGSRDSPGFKAKQARWWISQLKRTTAAEQDRDRERERVSDQLQALASGSLAIGSGRSSAEVAQSATDAARRLIGTSFSATSFVVDENWSRAIQAVSASEEYAGWRGYEESPEGSGFSSFVRRMNRPLRLSTAELDTHPDWLESHSEAGWHPPLRGLLAAPLVAHDGRNMGLICLTDKAEGEFTADDEAMLVRLTQMASVAIEKAQVYEEVMAEAERHRALSRQLLEAQEAARRHLVLELHDEVGQTLTGLRLLLRPRADRSVEACRSKCDEARVVIDELLARIRSITFDLRPASLDQFGLLPALLALFEQYTSQTGVRILFRHEGLHRRFESRVETTAYRIVQEALTNVARHADIDEAGVRIWANEAMLGLQIEDAGRGFDPKVAMAVPNTSGLAGMRERVMLLGGRLTIDPSPGAGTHLIAELPLKGAAPGGIDGHFHRPGG